MDGTSDYAASEHANSDAAHSAALGSASGQGPSPADGDSTQVHSDSQHQQSSSSGAEGAVGVSSWHEDGEHGSAEGRPFDDLPDGRYDLPDGRYDLPDGRYDLPDGGGHFIQGELAVDGAERKVLIDDQGLRNGTSSSNGGVLSGGGESGNGESGSSSGSGGGGSGGGCQDGGDGSGAIVTKLEDPPMGSAQPLVNLGAVVQREPVEGTADNTYGVPRHAVREILRGLCSSTRVQTAVYEFWLAKVRERERGRVCVCIRADQGARERGRVCVCVCVCVCVRVFCLTTVGECVSVVWVCDPGCCHGGSRGCGDGVAVAEGRDRALTVLLAWTLT